MDHRPDTLKSRGRPRLFDRDAALDIAMRLFWTRGFEATSMHDLSTAMGINPPSVYAAFGDKKALFREAVGRYCAGAGGFAIPAMSGHATARAAIGSLMLAAADAYTDSDFPRGCMVIHAGTNCSPAADDIAAELALIRSQVEAAITERISVGQRDGDVSSVHVAAEMGAYFAAVLQGMSTHARDGGTRQTLRAIADQAMKSWPPE